MAGRIILGTANPSLDGNGKPVSGSTLTFYKNITTTLQSIFSAIDLLTPLANPLPCDASGEFPQVWAPDATPYSVKWSRPGEADVTFNDIFPMSLASSNNFRAVDVVATSNIALSGGLANGQTIDGQLLSTGMRVLLSAQSAGLENGIYDVPVSGVPSRSADSNASASLPNGVMVIPQRGTSFKDTIWLHTTPVGFTLGVTALTFASMPLLSSRQVLTSTAGSPYVTPPGVRQLRIRLKAGGGGGGGNENAGATNGTAGGNTSFDNAGANVIANGGSGGTAGSSGASGGTGGTGTGTGIKRWAGAAGNAGGKAAATIILSAYGGTGGGKGGGPSSTNAVANTGGGGGGAIIASPASEKGSGPGGGEGEEVEFIINNPAATYAFTVGIGGAAGTGAGAGASGVIIVDEIR